MAKYLVQGNYVGDGVAGLLKEGGSSRREAANKAIESVGGSIDAMYYAFGDVDVYAIVDFPDTASAAASSTWPCTSSPPTSRATTTAAASTVATSSGSWSR